MKKSEKTVFNLVLAIVLLFVSCENSNIKFTNEDVNGGSFTPYAGEELLTEISSNENNVNWKVARFFALNDLDDYRSENSWGNAWLSEYPLVIYNSETGNPRYYEFRVLKDGSEVGAISCAIDKEEGSPVQYVMPFVHEIGTQTARSVESSTSKLVDRGYPGRLLSQQQFGNTARSVDASTDVEVIEEFPVDAKSLDVLLNASKEELELLGIDSVEIYDNYIAMEQEKLKKLASFWEEVDELKEKIVSMTEEELIETFSSDSSRAITTSYINTYTLTDWVNKSTWYYPGTYCGPNVVAFTMLGLGAKSGYENVPTVNNYVQLKSYYLDIEEKMGEGPKLFHWFEGDSLNGWLIDFTD